MQRYCLDTSGLSNPLENMPEDIHASLWQQIAERIRDGQFLCNTEIMDELRSIPGQIGACLVECCSHLCLEIGDNSWPWEDYLSHVEHMRVTHEAVISEYNGNRKNTVGLNDVSIIAFAKAMALPLVSMERANVHQRSLTKMRIPDVCAIEKVKHLSFNEYLRAEGIRA